MNIFDTNADGALQLSEMPPLEKFRNTLDQLRREEKRLADEAAKQKLQEEQAVLLKNAKLDFLNEKPASVSDRVISILPYLFPLMDGLQYGRFLLSGDTSNPFIVLLAVLYGLYRSIPFSGFVAFFALNFLSGNPSINRLVRYNMQQAIFIDIALFFPSLILGVGGLIANGAGGGALPPGVSEIFSDVIFGTLLVMLGYCVVSSAFGREPDGIPLISDAVKDRMPTIDMFDDEGRFVPREFRNKDEDEKKD